MGKNPAGVAEKDFSKISGVLDLPDLIEVQTASFKSFLQKDVVPGKRAKQGLQAVFEEIFPIESADGSFVLEFVSYSLDEPVHTQQECNKKGIDYSVPLRVKLRLAVREKTGAGEAAVKFVREHEVYFGEVPLMTENGTFIINGSERVIVCQLHRSPGIFFERKEHPVKRLYSCKIIPYRGTWLDLEFDQHNVVTISIDGRRRFPVSTFLRAVGYEKTADIIKLFLEDSIEKLPPSKARNRILAVDAVSGGGDVLAEAGEYISDMLYEKLKRNRISEVSVVTQQDYEATIIPTLAKDTVSSRDEALSQIYRKLRPGDPFTLQDAEDYINRLCFNKKFYDLGEVGRFKINRKLGLDSGLDETVLKKEDIVEAVRYMFKLMSGEGRADDIDHLGNRRVRTVGELVQNQFRIGFARIERVIRERFNIFDPEDENLAALVHPKIVMGVIKDFFARSQLSQFMDQVNPLAELTHKRRLSALGPGGLSRERAGFEVRDVHFSHYGRICPIETPEGANIGLIVSLSNYARVNEFGFIETPYRKVSRGKVAPEIEYLDAYTEDEYMIAQANARLDEKGKLTGERVFARYRENFLRVSPSEINYMDVSPLQLVSSAASLIPFLEHDDANRALMGCNMQRQAVPLIQTEAPLVKTGMEITAARDSGAVIIAAAPGRVARSTAEHIVIEGDDGVAREYSLRKFIGTNQNTCINQRPIVSAGDRVAAGDVIADGPSTRNGELALGRNVLVAFMPWLGYNFEDAIVISERFVKEDVFTSIHIEELDIDARETKLGVEEITRDIPNMPEGSLGNLDENGIIRIGSQVGPGDVLVGKITYRSETELSSEEKLLRSIFGDKARNVKDASLKVSAGTEGVVVDVKVLSRERGDSKENAAEIAEIKAEYKKLRQKLKENQDKKVFELLKGLKLSENISDPKSGRTLLKEGSRISSSNFSHVRKSGLRNLENIIDRKKFEELEKLLSVFEDKIIEYKRDENREIEQLLRGDELPHGVVKIVKVYLASKKKVSAGDKMAGRHGNKGVIATVVREEDMPYLADGTPVDIALNPLGVPSRMNVGQILETHLGWAARALGFSAVTPVFSGAVEEEIKEALDSAGLPRSGKAALYDGRTGEKFDQEVTVGYIYMMKLSHLVDDKVHARSTGPYSLVTQQPLGGKAHSGGQRLGEMEVWALEAYGAAYTLQELLTVKSDDVEGRTNMYEAICKGEDARMAGTPESFNVLIKELQGLGLSVNLAKKQLPAGDTGMPSSSAGRSVFDSVTVGIASPESIKEMSRGEVKKPETINYRTLKPEKDGLFCEKIFGPTRDFECNCGKYKRVKHKGVVCDRCGVEVTHSRVRRERTGHISLVAPVVHIWFFKVIPSRIGNLLDIPVPALERVAYYESYVVIDPGKTSLSYKQVLTEDEYRKYYETYGDEFKALIGAEAVEALLKEIDLVELEKELKSEVDKATSKQKLARLNKRLAVVRALRESGNKPEWMVMKVLPVIPADLRPLVPLDGGRVATSDLNDLYRRVINRNERLKSLIEISAPDIIIRNEKRMLQEAVDALFDNGRRGRPVLGAGSRPLKSLSDNLRGKQGRFRQNLLGKRVDYSGRSVVVVGPELKLHQCGLPKKMALQLFEPFIVRELRSRGFVHTIKSARKMVEEVAGEVWAILEDVIREHPVLLNRAPTLHRLGIQAFEPILIEGKSIQIHPLVCTAFNADFDGDQMAVHVPLSTEAQLESRILMASNNNLFSPSNGRPIVVPSQDIVLGCSYITKERKSLSGEVQSFSSPDEVLLAYWLDYISLHSPVRVRINNSMVETTVGRVFFNSVLPEGMPFYNEVQNKKQIEKLIDDAYRILGHSATVGLLDAIKDIGFKEATTAGLSISADDMVIPEVKAKLIEQANEKVDSIRKHYRRGLITERERFNKVVDVWMHVSGELSDILFEELSSVDEGFNPIFMMSDSGARGSFTQIRQLAGMRGLMAKPSGDIIESPIIANFREGLTVLEYFISTHGARKGLADTALKTADSGYLTRRLVDVAQDVIIVERDCGTVRGIEVSGIFEGEDIVATLYERILGRTALEDIKIPILGNVLVKQGELIDEEKASLVEEAGIDSVKIRSVLTCKTRHGACANCYGWDLALKKLVNIGTAAGIIAAQSIGEPGTQLTMRTFHIGGTASRIVEKTNIIIRESGKVKYHGLRTVFNREGNRIVVNRNGYISLHDEDDREIEKYHIPVGALLKVEDNSNVKKGVVAAEWDPYTVPIFSEVSGRVDLEDIEEGLTVVRETDEVTGHAMLVVIEHKEEKHPQIVIRSKNGDILGYYTIPTGSNIMVEAGDEVEAGDLLAKNPRQIFSSRDITGGLPRVASLFEARRPKDPAIISEISGAVEFAGTVKGMRKIVVKNESGMQKEYLIPPGKHLNVYKGDKINAGDALIDGPVVLEDKLRVSGEKELQEYLLNEVQEVYRLQGVAINDKHIEVIMRQMMRKVRIEDKGDTRFLVGEEINRFEVEEENEKVRSEGGRPAGWVPVIMGITKASLSTDSFISAASFQETTRVLTDAAVRGRTDELRGLKENVIMGKLVPAGTGVPMYHNIKVETVLTE